MEHIDITRIHNLSPTEAVLLRKILDHIKAGQKAGVREIARAGFVSTTSVVKLAKKLGYTGYSEMMFSLSKDMTALRTEEHAFQYAEFFPHVSPDAIEAFARHLRSRQNSRIYTLGLGFSALAASYMDKKLGTVNFQTYDGSPLDMTHGHNRESLVFVVSQSAGTDDLYRVVNQSKAYGHIFILFTGNPNGKIASLADLVFPVGDGPSAPLTHAPDYFIGKVLLLFEYLLSYYLLSAMP